MRLGLRAAAWAALLVLAIAALAWQATQRAAPRDDDHEATAVPLVGLDYAQWAAVELLHRGQRTRFERDAAARWFAHRTQAGEPADHSHAIEVAAAERLDAALATFSRTRIERSLEVDAAHRSNYGLDNPTLIVLVHAPDGRVAVTIEVGQAGADAMSRYVHVPQTGDVHMIADYQVGGLLALLGDQAAPGAGR